MESSFRIFCGILLLSVVAADTYGGSHIHFGGGHIRRHGSSLSGGRAGIKDNIVATGFGGAVISEQDGGLYRGIPEQGGISSGGSFGSNNIEYAGVLHGGGFDLGVHSDGFGDGIAIHDQGLSIHNGGHDHNTVIHDEVHGGGIGVHKDSYGAGFGFQTVGHGGLLSGKVHGLFPHEYVTGIQSAHLVKSDLYLPGAYDDGIPNLVSSTLGSHSSFEGHAGGIHGGGHIVDGGYVGSHGGDIIHNEGGFGGPHGGSTIHDGGEYIGSPVGHGGNIILGGKHSNSIHGGIQKGNLLTVKSDGGIAIPLSHKGLGDISVHHTVSYGK